MIAIVDNVNRKKGVTLRMLNADTDALRTVAMRDLDETDQVKSAYPIGKIVRAVVNKSGRLSLKKSVIDVVDPSASKKD